MNRLVFLAFLLPLTVTGSAADGETIAVGSARVDVTPTFPVRLHGYSNRATEFRAVAGKLWVKALAIGSDAEGPSVLVSVDNLGVPGEMVERIAARLKADAGVARERFAVCASHTHSAPALAGVAPNIYAKPLSDEEKAHIDRYTQVVEQAIESSAREALKARRPANLAWSQGTVGFAINRRALKDGKWTGFGEVPAGPVDHALPVLRATDESGKVLAVVANYACHCTTFKPDENAVHGDWAGFAQEMIEADHPGATALTIIGCGADANPRSRNQAGLDVARAHGRSLADEVKRLLAGPMTPLSVAPEGSLRRIALPFAKLPSREELLQLKAKAVPIGSNAAIQLAALDRDGKLPSAIDYPVQAWRFGDDLAIVFLAGEVVVDYAIRLKADLDPARLWVVAYANDAPCYIPSARILREGGYEADDSMLFYARPSRLAPEIEEAIVTTAEDLLPKSFRKAGR